MLAMIVIIIVIAVMAVLLLRSGYMQSEYHERTGNGFCAVFFNTGRLGEYNVYRRLKNLPGYGKFLFNVYIPAKADETTEIDAILLHETGIYVFESKNYSGWIFGDANQKMWTQTLPAGRGRSQKNHFFNPVMQNEGHIYWLQKYLGDDSLHFYSYIVFSDRCTLKRVNPGTKNCRITQLGRLRKDVMQNIGVVGNRMTVSQIDALFERLCPLTSVDDSVKARHIADVKAKQH